MKERTVRQPRGLGRMLKSVQQVRRISSRAGANGRLQGICAAPTREIEFEPVWIWGIPVIEVRALEELTETE